MKDARVELCCVCMCSDKKILPLSDYLKKECFTQILNEVTNSPALQTLQLCWQCEAYARNFVNFKHQVKKSYLLLTDVNNQVTKYDINNKSLSISKVIELSISTNQTNEETFQVIYSKQPINEVYLNGDDCNYSDNVPSDSDTLLIEISNKNKLNKKRSLFKEILLNNKEVIEERTIAEKSDDYVNAMFRCVKCIVTFPNEDDLKEHVQKKHELHASKHKCTICECSFSSEVSFNYHKRRHKRRYQCTACGNKSVSKRAAVKHYEMVHCHSETYELEKLQNGNNQKIDIKHDDEIKSETSYPCDSCDKVFKWKTSLRKHMETHKIEAGQKRKPYCEPCRLSFTTTCNLQKHVKTSSKHQIQLKLRKLQESNVDINNEALSKEVANIKVSVNSAREVFSCPQCDRKFQWRGNMLRHLKTHNLRAKGELICTPCNRTFSSIATYKQHMEVSKKHATENDFKYICSDCGKRFANKTKLKDHIDWEHLKNYVHTCTDCKKIFKSHTSLYLHRQVVHKKMNSEHLCDHCGKSFPNQSKLRGHMTALHSGAAPFACGSCSARFSWHSCLSRHVRRIHRDKTTHT